ncbi:DUF2269 domain-containing protein [Corynebacterium poyangense]|uniref:DUF2269 domain-containing protein n=1 Tax=Corynebacterium poyangense TaxID=2684405 RepID=A0A7H0SN98_9CORY|nr:DUF2269 domain-containing protein [Corynebacterium poyangense]MBZ8177047.1 DUF2269 domain-containing protein [Corynebacterium poyangense]QNQ90023.1 DUF2269 domain-containing protein [Corynebacterium poyangense]
MHTLLLALHVIGAILLLGPVTVAVSSFHVQAYQASKGKESARGTAQLLHAITKTYGVISVLVPAIGFALMFTKSGVYWSQGRFHVSILLSVIAWALLIIFIIPRQKRMLGALNLLEDGEQQEAEAEGEARIANWDSAKKQLSMFGGIFSLLWIIVAILMIV